MKMQRDKAGLEGNTRSRLVTRVLFQVRVGYEFVRRDRIQVKVCIGRNARLHIAFPLPNVVAACELAEADEIGPALRLPPQLAAALSEDAVHRERSVRRDPG